MANELQSLVKAELDRFFPGELRTEWNKFIQLAAMPAGQFILMLACTCGCMRVMHYKINNADLVYKPGQKAASHSFVYSLTAAIPNNDECAPVPIPMAWLQVPHVNLKMPIDHREFDRVVGPLMDKLARSKCT